MKSFICLLFICNLFITTSAQKIHINTFIGAANYYGDLQSKRYTFNQAKLAFGLGLSYEISDNFFIRGILSRAAVSADDKLNPQTRVRNLNFTTAITEAQLAGEYYFRSLDEYSISPYLFAGVAVFHFNPYTKDTSQNTFYLQPLSTEGQGFYLDRKPYNLNQIAIPFGGGIKLALSDNIHVGMEIGLRKLFTDYLDDVSTTYIPANLLSDKRGSKAVDLAYRGYELKGGPPYPTGDNRGGANFKDWYYFTALTASFRIGGSGRIGKYQSELGCPTRVY
ncbi:MAG: DUF6089 family protein [Bacteroidota bacterium]|nr:DUF6089 family protein [Bacteroidota bacterium]